MAEPARVTEPLLDVLDAFLVAWREDRLLHGWAISKQTRRSGPTVYGLLERLEEWGWISGSWEEQPPNPKVPRRRLYRLTPNGMVRAEGLLSERRPAAKRHLRLRFDFVRPRTLFGGGAR